MGSWFSSNNLNKSKTNVKIAPEPSASKLEGKNNIPNSSAH